jgi:hypothetical protein
MCRSGKGAACGRVAWPLVFDVLAARADWEVGSEIIDS